MIPFPFASFGTNGESLTLTGLSAADVEVYKGVSMTQRSSDNGYALMDTDGIDLDSRTGIHGFSIDTGDDTDAGVNTIDDLLDTEIPALTTAVADLPTNAELATALGTADDAVLSAIAALNNLSAAEVNAEVDTAISDASLATAANLATVDNVVDAVKTQTDKLTFTVANQLDANIQSINDVTVTGDGQVGTEWGV